MFGRIGPTELILILAVALIIIGPSKLPEFGRSLGKGIKEFRSSLKDMQEKLDEDDSKASKKE